MEKLGNFFTGLYQGMVNCSSDLFGYNISIWDLFVTSAILGIAAYLIWGFFGRR